MGKRDGMFRRTQRVAGVRVPELHHRTDVARAQRSDRLPVLAIQQVDLADAFGDFAVAVEQVCAAVDRAGIDAEKGKFAKMRLGHGLENIGDGFAALQRDQGFVAVGIKGRDFFPVHGRGTVLGDEIHEPRDADVFFRRGGEQGDEQLSLHRHMDARPEFLLRQGALLKILVHQLVVRFGDVFDEFAVERRGFFRPFAGGGFLGVFAGAVRGVGDNFTAKHVERAVETGAGVHRDDKGNTCRPNWSCAAFSAASKSTFSLSSALMAIIFGRP